MCLVVTGLCGPASASVIDPTEVWGGGVAAFLGLSRGAQIGFAALPPWLVGLELTVPFPPGKRIFRIDHPWRERHAMGNRPRRWKKHSDTWEILFGEGENAFATGEDAFATREK